MRKEYYLKFYYNISIRSKLVTILCLLVFLPIIIIGYLGYQNFENIMKEKFISYSQKNVMELSTILTDRIEKLVTFTQDILYDNKIYDVNEQLLSNDDNDAFSEYLLKSNFETYLNSILFSRADVDTILFYFTSKNRTYYADRYYSNDADATTPIKSIYEIAKLAQGKTIWYYENKDGKVSDIYVARILYDRYSLKEIGMIILKVNKNYLFGILSDFLSNNTQNVSIYNSNNVELFKFNTYQADYQSTLNKLLNSKDTASTYEDNVKNDQIYFIYNKLAPLDWKIIVSISSNILLKEARIISRNMILLCILTLPFWFVLIELLYIDIIKPMNLLISNMHKIERGQTGVTVETNRNDELGYVFKTFNKMSLEINNLINSVYKKQIAVKDAEIKALQSQINPHFLYNTLETINWKAKLFGADEISDMIMALSAIMEANLNRKDEILIPLKKEIEYIDNYNLLIAMRFGRKIRFKKNVLPETLNCEIPRLIIQPLIENSIYHGLETKKGGGTVELSVRLKENCLPAEGNCLPSEENCLLIEVKDNGLGIDNDTLEQLKINLAENNDESAFSNSKIGVMNVHKRIKLLYGEKYGLEISSELGKGTDIILKLPIRIYKGVIEYEQSNFN